MASGCDDGFPDTWVARLVEKNRVEFDLLHELELEIIADGDDNEFNSLLGMMGGSAPRSDEDEVLTFTELREMYGNLAVPEPGDYGDVTVLGGVDQFRLTCAFVLGVLGRWDEAFAHMGAFPGSFDRHEPMLFSSRLDVVIAMMEDGRWEDVVAHAGVLSFDCESVLGEGSGLAVTLMVLRGEALARLGEPTEALRLFRLALELGEGLDDIEDLVLESAREHETFLVLGAPL